MSELDRCKHCGGEAEASKGSMINHHVFCMSCNASTGRGYSTKEQAIAAWNRRPPAHKYTLEELRGMDKKPQPIYIASLNTPEGCIHTGSWKICYGIDPPHVHGGREMLNLNSGFFMDTKDYDKKYVAYDREPEEETV